MEGADGLLHRGRRHAVDWREGYAHFRDRSVDHDTANDAGGRQWAASTGTDAEYVRRYVPELRGVPAAEIHRWNEPSPARRDELAGAYPDPIVDHAERREEAIATFAAARGD